MCGDTYVNNIVLIFRRFIPDFKNSPYDKDVGLQKFKEPNEKIYACDRFIVTGVWPGQL